MNGLRKRVTLHSKDNRPNSMRSHDGVDGAGLCNTRFSQMLDGNVCSYQFQRGTAITYLTATPIPFRPLQTLQPCERLWAWFCYRPRSTEPAQSLTWIADYSCHRSCNGQLSATLHTPPASSHAHATSFPAQEVTQRASTSVAAAESVAWNRLVEQGTAACVLIRKAHCTSISRTNGGAFAQVLCSEQFVKSLHCALSPALRRGVMLPLLLRPAAGSDALGARRTAASRAMGNLHAPFECETRNVLAPAALISL